MDDAIDGMTRRQMEDLAEKLTKRLQTCALCGEPGAVPTKAVMMSGPKKSSSATLMMCVPCFEKHRLPEKRSDSA